MSQDQKHMPTEPAEMLEGFGKCPDCIWFNDPGGCNVKRGSKTCLLNKRPPKQLE